MSVNYSEVKNVYLGTSPVFPKFRLCSHGRLAVHVGDRLLEQASDVGASALQRGREEAVGHAERLGVQVEVFHLECNARASQYGGTLLTFHDDSLLA